MPDSVALDSRLIPAIQQVVREDSPDGFLAFYRLVLNRKPPAHVKEWVRAIFEAREARQDIALEAFRGSTKTTVLLALCAYWHGLYPHKTGMIIQSGDDAAKDSSNFFKKLIESNAAWKICFPGVVPDKETGWGEGGYWLKREDMDYSEFIRMRTSKDPTFVAYGYTSGAIVGKHPSLYILVDDILNEENTRSSREHEHVEKVFNGTIMPTRTLETFSMLAFTPWFDGDLYRKAVQTGAYRHVFTNVYGKGTTGTSIWPEGMPDEEIKRREKQDTTGGVEFARMYLLDLTARTRRIFKYQSYPAHLVNTSWPMVGGCDYADAPDPTRRHNTSSHFALAYVAKLPEGGAVVYDGVVEQWTQAESEGSIARAQAMFPNWEHTVIETDGKGLTFYNMLYRRPEMKIYPIKTGGRSKASRLVNELGPWLESGRIRISDADTPFLNAARNFMNKYPTVEEHDKGWDVMDAIYDAAMGMPDVLVVPPIRDTLPGYERRTRQANPWASLGASVNA